MWGFLIYWVTRLIKFTLESASQRQRRIMKIGFCLFSVALGVCAVVFNLPATPISFTPSPEAKTVVDGNNTFALDLYQKLKDRPGNVFFSPFNISTALAMTSAGARGETEMEMTNVLHLNLPRENCFRLSKRSRAHRENSALESHCSEIGQFALVPEGLSVEKEFTRLVDENYFAQTKSVDFKNAPGDAANQINRWVERKTSGRISSVAAADQFTPLTRLALCDAIISKASGSIGSKRVTRSQRHFTFRPTKPSPFR